MKPRHRQILLLLGLVMFLVGLILAASHYRAKRAVASYKKQLLAAGEELTVDDLRPLRILPQQNGAEILRRAEKLLAVRDEVIGTNPPTAMSIVSPGRAMIRWAQTDVRSRQATNTWAEIEAALARNRGALDLLGMAAEKPGFDFELDYNLGIMVPLRHLMTFRDGARLLSAAAEAELREGDTAAALGHLRTPLALLRGLEDERTTISQLVRVAVTVTTLNTVWEFLQSPDVTGEQLQTLQQDLARLEFIQAAEKTLSMERAFTDTMLGQARKRSSSIRDMMIVANAFSGDDDEKAGDGKGKTSRSRAWGMKLREDAWRYWWSYPDQLALLRAGQILIEAARQVQAEERFDHALARQANRLAELRIPPFPNDHTAIEALDLRNLFSQSMLSNQKYLSRVMTIEAVRQLAVTAIALKRYQLRHGHLAADLAALAPEFLGGVPGDPVDGQPLRYRPNKDGSFLLYSIGEDGVDGGGDPRPANEASKSLYWGKGRDWVWPQAASAEEVEAFHRKMGEPNR